MQIRIGHKRTFGYTWGGLKCLWGISIPCRPATPAVDPISRSGKRYTLQSKQCIKKRTAFGLLEGSTGKLYRINDRRKKNIYGVMPVNDTFGKYCSINEFVRSPTSNLKLKPMLNKLLHIKSVARDIQLMQVMTEHCWICKERKRWRYRSHPVCHEVDLLVCRLHLI
jgi:hypothetical protein